MKALILPKAGLPDSLEIANIEKPTLLAGHILVRVSAVALNPVDYKIASRPLETYPFILGLDVAGVVEAIGEDVSGWKIGERVFYHGSFIKGGGFAEYTVAPAHIVARIPDEVSFEDAAAILCAGLTAYQALFRKFHISPSHTILVHGGAGGVGGFAVQLASNVGATVIATASTPNHELVKKLGAQYVIDYKKENLKERVKEITKGRGVDAVVDTVGKESATEALSMLSFGGHLICIAGLPDFSVIVPFTKAPSIHEICLGAAHASGDQKAQEELAIMATEMIQLVKYQKINAMVTKKISLEEVPQGLNQLMQRNVVGKIVVNHFN